jgi:hypothetical protein
MAYGGNWRNNMVAQSQDLTSSGLSIFSLTRHAMQSSGSIGGLTERMWSGKDRDSIVILE